jgi:hypothetical protein
MKTFDLTVSRTVPGSAEDVFDVWLDPTSPGGLWHGVERVIVNRVWYLNTLAERFEKVGAR